MAYNYLRQSEEDTTVEKYSGTRGHFPLAVAQTYTDGSSGQKSCFF